jgi:transcriptional regulator with XRE-family HTH domain
MAKARKTEFELAVIAKVTEIRLAKGISQSTLAEMLGLTSGFIGQIESPNSPSKYNLNHLNRLAYELDCSPKEFMPDGFVEDDWE